MKTFIKVEIVNISQVFINVIIDELTTISNATEEAITIIKKFN